MARRRPIRRVELDLAPTDEMMRQAVASEVNFEVERALEKVRKYILVAAFATSAMVAGLLLRALLFWNDETLGPAFTVFAVGATWFFSLWGSVKRRTIEVRLLRVPVEGEDEFDLQGRLAEIRVMVHWWRNQDKGILFEKVDVPWRGENGSDGASTEGK
jgi:hypothetical protein